LLRDFAGAQFVPVFPTIGAGAENLAVPVASQHRSGRQVDGRNVHAGGAQKQARGGLVTPPHQHCAVNGVRAQQFLRLHRQHVAIHHGGRLDEALGDRQCGEFDREAACHQDAALHVVDALLEVHMAGLQVRPSVNDGDNRFTLPLLRRVAHLHGAGAVAERTQVGWAEPVDGS
jgi:hypothetical protein